MIAEEYRNCMQKAPKKDFNKIVKDFECATCAKWLDCEGHPKGVNYLNYTERKKENK